MKRCWQLKGCPASHYLSCEAYKKGESCWVNKNGCLCKAGLECRACPIYAKHVNDEDGSK